MIPSQAVSLQQKFRSIQPYGRSGTFESTGKRMLLVQICKPTGSNGFIRKQPGIDRIMMDGAMSASQARHMEARMLQKVSK